MKSSYQPAQKRAPLPQCEPTIICEGHTFQLRKVPQLEHKVDRGAMFNRIEECLNDLKNIEETINALKDPTSLSAVNGIREELLLLLEHHGVQNCELHRQLLQPLALTQPINKPAVLNYFNGFRIAAIRACFCSALIPPCPDAVDDNCVPLARVTMSCKDGCRIVRVCNWENRRIVPTVPNLEYWLEGFVRTSGIPEFLDDFCCKPIGETPEKLKLFTGGGINIGGVNININNIQGAVETFRDHLKKLVKALIT